MAKFYVGQPVWVDMNRPEDGYVGRYAGTIAHAEPWLGSHWGCDIPAAPYKDGRTLWWNVNVTPRDPPKREDIGEWALCPWQPAQPITTSDKS